MVPNSHTHMNDTLGQPCHRDTPVIRKLLVAPKVSAFYRLHWCPLCETGLGPWGAVEVGLSKKVFSGTMGNLIWDTCTFVSGKVSLTVGVVFHTV